MQINLYIDTVFKKVKSLRMSTIEEVWTTHIIALHGYVVDEPIKKVPSTPSKHIFTTEGYRDIKSDHEKVRPSGFIDIVLGANIEMANPYTQFLNTIKKLIDNNVTHDISKYTINLYHLHPARPSILPNPDPIMDGKFIREDFVLKVAKELNATLRGEEIPKVISEDLISMGCLESVAQGRLLQGYSKDFRYWKKNERPKHLRGDTQLALTGDTGREFRSMQYEGEDMVSTEKFSSTNTAHVIKEPDPLYTDVLSIFNKYYNKPEHQKVLIEVDTKGMYSKHFSALYNKFGISMLHVIIGDADKQSTIILGDFFNGQTKDMVTIKPMIRIPDPGMIMTRVYLTELFRLGLKYIMEGDQVLATEEYSHITKFDIVPVEWNGSFDAKIVVKGRHWEMPFVPEVGFHTEQLSNAYAKLKDRVQYSMSIEAYGIVYHATVVGNDEMLYAGACGELPILLGSRSTAKKKIEIEKPREETVEWHNKIYDHMLKHGMYGKPSKIVL